MQSGIRLSSSRKATLYLFFKLFKFILKNSLKKNRLKINRLELLKSGWMAYFYYPGTTNLVVKPVSEILTNTLLINEFDSISAFLIGVCYNPNTQLHDVKKLIKKFNYVTISF
jgi:hypothetical protein